MVHDCFDDGYISLDERIEIAREMSEVQEEIASTGDQSGDGTDPVLEICNRPCKQKEQEEVSR